MPNDITRPGEGEAAAKQPTGVSARARRSYAWAGLVAGIGYLVGAILGGVGTAALVEKLGWSMAFQTMAAAAVIAVMAAWRLTRAEVAPT